MDVRELIKAGRSECIAWAPCRNGIHTEVFETICAMANTAGGVMLLGVNDDGSILGFTVKIISNVIRGMIQAFENPDIFNPVLHLMPKEAVIEDKHVIIIQIPESADIHTMRGRVYIRRGDFTGFITHGSDMARLYQKKSRLYTDGKIYPYLKVQDLDLSLLRRIQKRVRIFDPQHPWAVPEEEKLLEMMNLMGVNYETGEKGLRFAAAVLIGKSNTIQNIFAGVTFCIEDRRYRTITREYLETNLLDAYERLTSLTGEVLGTSKAAEYTAAMLLKRNYNDLSPVTITMTKDAVTSDIDEHSSLQGNPVLERIFRESAMGCEIYTVKKKMHAEPFNETKTAKAEDQAPQRSVKLNEEKKLPEAEASATETINRGVSPEARREQILEMMGKDSRIGVGVMAQRLGVAKRTILRDIDKMKKTGMVERVGPEKGGSWVVRL